MSLLGKRGGEADQPFPLRRLARLQRAQGEDTHRNDFVSIRESVPEKPPSFCALPNLTFTFFCNPKKTILVISGATEWDFSRLNPKTEATFCRKQSTKIVDETLIESKRKIYGAIAQTKSLKSSNGCFSLLIHKGS